MTPPGLTLSVILMVIYCQAILPPDFSPNGLQPIYTRKDPLKYGYGVKNVFQFPFSSECRYKSFGLTGAKIHLCKTSFRYSRTRPASVTYKLGHMNRNTVKAFSQVFQGLLQPRAQSTASRGPPQHDYDMCCPTVQQMRQAPFQQVDVLGNDQVLIHLPANGIYQYYHAGTCLEPEEETYCHGKCIQATSTVFLAVFRLDLDVGFSFAPFTVPSYCSCRNIGQSQERPFGRTIRYQGMGANITAVVGQVGVSGNGQTGDRVLPTSSQSTNGTVLNTSPQNFIEDKKETP